MSSSDASNLNFNIDLDEIEALNQKRTLAFINHWVYNTVLFLNQFSRICEQRLLNLETKLRRSSDLLSTLESKLSSIPGLDDVEADTTATNTQPVLNRSDDLPKPITPEVPKPTTHESEDVSKTPKEENESRIPISSHPLYAPYFKMVTVGVPREAVKLKMKASGVDPALLDDPTAEIEYKKPEHSSPSDSD